MISSKDSMTNGDKIVTLEQISDDEAREFVARHPLGNFLQSVAIARRRRDDGWEAYPVALRGAEGGIVAFAMLHARKTGPWREFECQQGPLLDYDNEALVTKFFPLLEQFVKQIGGVTLRINPPVLARQRDEDGTTLEGTETTYTAQLESVGYRHIPNTLVDQTPYLLRWYFTKDLQDIHDRDELLASIDQQTRWAINKAKRTGVTVRTITDERELGYWTQLIFDTAKRLGFDGRDPAYYQGLFREFTRDEAQFAIAELSKQAYETFLKNEMSGIDAEVAAYTDETSEGKRRDAAMRRGGYEKKLSTIDEVFGEAERLPLAAALFIHTGQQLVYFMSGASEIGKSFGGAYALQDWALTYALDHHIPRYSFYGTMGNFSGHPNQEGVYQFKKGFGGVVEEQIGYFVVTPRPFAARLIPLLRAVMRRVKRLF